MNHGDAAHAEQQPKMINPGVALPLPAAGQILVYANSKDEVQVVLCDASGGLGFVLDPEQARTLADRLYDAAYDIDGGGYDADLGTF